MCSWKIPFLEEDIGHFFVAESFSRSHQRWNLTLLFISKFLVSKQFVYFPKAKCYFVEMYHSNTRFDNFMLHSTVLFLLSFRKPYLKVLYFFLTCLSGWGKQLMYVTLLLCSYFISYHLHTFFFFWDFNKVVWFNFCSISWWHSTVFLLIEW